MFNTWLSYFELSTKNSKYSYGYALSIFRTLHVRLVSTTAFLQPHLPFMIKVMVIVDSHYSAAFLISTDNHVCCRFTVAKSISLNNLDIWKKLLTDVFKPCHLILQLAFIFERICCHCCGREAAGSICTVWNVVIISAMKFSKYIVELACRDIPIGT